LHISEAVYTVGFANRCGCGLTSGLGTLGRSYSTRLRYSRGHLHQLYTIVHQYLDLLLRVHRTGNSAGSGVWEKEGKDRGAK